MRNTLSKMWVSFRDSVGGLLDSKGTADDVKGLLWLAVDGVVGVLFLTLLRGWDRRKPMRNPIRTFELDRSAFAARP